MEGAILNTKFISPKVLQTLTQLFPHLTENEFVVVGGIAIKHGLAQRQQENVHITEDNVDLIIKNEDSLSPNVSRDFMISHYHSNPGTVDPFYFSLVDPETKVFVNVFNSNILPATERETVTYENFSFLVRTLADQFVTSLIEANRPLTGVDHAVEDKKVEDLHRMNKVVDWNTVDRIWNERAKVASFDKFPYGAKETWEKLNIFIKENPDKIFKRKPKKERLKQPCSECEKVSNKGKYPLTPNEKILELLD